MDQHGFIVPVDDDDLSAIVEAAIEGDDARRTKILKDRFDRLILYAHCHQEATCNPVADAPREVMRE